MQRFIASRAAAAAAATGAATAAVRSHVAAACLALTLAPRPALPASRSERQASTSAHTLAPITPPASSLSSSSSPSSTAVATASDASAVAQFVDLGLPRPLARQLIAAFPHIHAPTLAQTALLEAITQPNDVILRAHTGTGKSFALLLALLAKPRVLFSQPASLSSSSEERQQQHGIASIIIVPSNELAFQYYSWARALLPQAGAELHPIMQVLVRGHPTLSAQDQLDLLRKTPPHLIVATPTRLLEILSGKTNDGHALLGLSTLRTLALDEVDALLDLPGRFPTHKLKWKHTVHPAPALVFLNEVMRLRPSCSGGQLLPSAGLERDEGRHFDERRPPDAIRRTAHRSREALISKQQQAQKQESSAHSFYSAFNFALPKPRYGPTGSPPIQLVVTSATANAVLRHFFGARTGWLRTGVKDQIGRPQGQVSNHAYARQERITGVWLDLTGLTKASAELTASLDKGKKQKAKADEHASTFPTGAEGSLSAKLKAEGRVIDEADRTTFPMTMPEELTHYCLVVDEPSPNERSPLESEGIDSSATASDTTLASALPPMRNLDPRAFIRPWRKALDLVRTTSQPDLATTIRSASPPAHEVDPHLLGALAFAFASDESLRGLALVPAQWSLSKTKEMLEGWGVPVRLLDGGGISEGGNGAETTAAAEGKDSPVLYLLQATSARGLDLPVLTHVFIVGIEAVGDAVRYTHLAGRASRIGPNAELATIPQPQDPDNSEDGGGNRNIQTTLRPLAKVITIIRGLPHASVLRRRAALRAWSSLTREERAARGMKKPQHDAIMVSSAERKLWTVWRRTGVSGRKAGQGRSGGWSKWDLRLVGGETVEDEVALDGWTPEEDEAEFEEGRQEFEEEEEEMEDEVADGEGEGHGFTAAASPRWEPREERNGTRERASSHLRERREEKNGNSKRTSSPRWERREDKYAASNRASLPQRDRREDGGGSFRRTSAPRHGLKAERDVSFRRASVPQWKRSNAKDGGFQRTSDSHREQSDNTDGGFKRSFAQRGDRGEGRDDGFVSKRGSAPQSRHPRFDREGRKGATNGGEDRLEFGGSERSSGPGRRRHDSTGRPQTASARRW